jgi:MFS transporter, ACS family, aldohexuronate transporter
VRLPTRFRWVIAGTLFPASALSFFDRQVLSVLAPQILGDLRLTNVEYAEAVSAFTLAYGVTFTVGGRLIDLMGTRLGLGFSVAFWSLASLLHALARNGTHLTAFRFMLGAGEGGCFPGAAKGTLEWFPKRERALAMGLATTGGSAFGAILAPPLIVAVSRFMGWRGAVLATGFAGVVWVVAWFLLYLRPEESRFLSETERGLILGGREADRARAERPWPLPVLLQRREVWGFLATRFLLDPVFYFYMFWIPQYLHRERGASLDEISRLSWIPFLSLGIASLLGGGVSDRLVCRGWPAARGRRSWPALRFSHPSLLGLHAAPCNLGDDNP